LFKTWIILECDQAFSLNMRSICVRVRGGRFSNFPHASRRGVPGLHCAFTRQAYRDSHHHRFRCHHRRYCRGHRCYRRHRVSFSSDLDKESTAAQVEIKQQKYRATTLPDIIHEQTAQFLR